MLVDDLNEKQRAFVLARFEGKSDHEAAEAAGYVNPKLDAWRQKNHPKVRAAIDELRRTHTAELNINRQDVLQGFMDAVHAAATSTELTAAWREIGKIVDAYAPERVEVNVNINDIPKEKLAKMSDAQLLQLSRQEPGLLMNGEFEVVKDDDEETARVTIRE